MMGLSQELREVLTTAKELIETLNNNGDTHKILALLVKFNSSQNLLTADQKEFFRSPEFARYFTSELTHTGGYQFKRMMLALSQSEKTNPLSQECLNGASALANMMMKLNGSSYIESLSRKKIDANKKLFEQDVKDLSDELKNIKKTDLEKDYCLLPSSYLRSVSAEDQFARDKQIWQSFLHAAPEFHESDPTYEKKQEVMRMIFFMLNYLGDARHENMNLQSILSHGGRIAIEVPPLNQFPEGTDPNALFYALMGGKENISGKTTGEKAIAENKAVFTRTFASHSISMVQDEEKMTIKEERLNPKNPKDLGRFMIDSARGRHYGMNLGLGETTTAAPANGSNGHLYLYWSPPTHDKPGGLLLGVEGSAPGHVNRFGDVHDARALSAEFSPTGGQKFTTSKFDRYRDEKSVLALEGGLRLDLTTDQVQEIVKVSGNLQAAREVSAVPESQSTKTSKPTSTWSFFKRHKDGAAKDKEKLDEKTDIKHPGKYT